LRRCTGLRRRFRRAIVLITSMNTEKIIAV